MKTFLKDNSGSTAIEYGMIAGFIALMLVVMLPKITDAISTKFKTIGNGLDNIQ
jgi:pilus assembly protein Flp/PilA